MGLAPYGEPRFINQFREIVRTEERGQFRLHLDSFRHHAEGVEMTWDQGSPAIGRIFSDEFVRALGPARVPGWQLGDRERDIAASLQLRLEEIAFHARLRGMVRFESTDDLLAQMRADVDRARDVLATAPVGPTG